MFYLYSAIMLFNMWFNTVLLFNIVLYSHANVVTSASEQNFNSGDMALYK